MRRVVQVRVLVTNDDGITSAGLSTLARVAVDEGLDVTVAAPPADSSGASASLSALESDGRLRTHHRSLKGLAGVRALAVEASPAFITYASAYGAFGPRPDIVLSGINHGPNTGQAVLHSGTIGAALTARTHGISALAISCASPEPVHWDSCSAIAKRVFSWMLANWGPDPVTLSVNVPDLPLAQVRGLRPARLAASGAVQAEVGEIGEDHVTMTLRPVEAELEADTDAALLANGWATVTPLAAPCEAIEVDLGGLNDNGSHASNNTG